LPSDGAPSPSEEEWFDSETIRSDFTPVFSWNTTWNSGVNTTIGMTRSKSTEESQFNNVVSRTETSTSSIQFNSRYSFSAPRGISLFGKRLRFQSDLTVSLDFDTGEEKVVEANIQASGETTTTVRSHQKRLNVRPRATYNFSRKIQGSLDVSYSRNKDLQRERTETTITVAIEAVIKF
jgi:cell surface protein SprA